MKKFALILCVVLVGMAFAVPGRTAAQEVNPTQSGATIDEKTAVNLQSQLSAMKAMLLALQKEYAAKQTGNSSPAAISLSPQEKAALQSGLTALRGAMRQLSTRVEMKILSAAERSTFGEHLARIAINLNSLNNAMAKPLAAAPKTAASSQGSPAAISAKPELKPLAQQTQNILEENAPLVESLIPLANKTQATAAIAPLADKKTVWSAFVALAAAALGFWLWKRQVRKKETPETPPAEYADYSDYSERKSAV